MGCPCCENGQRKNTNNISGNMEGYSSLIERVGNRQIDFLISGRGQDHLVTLKPLADSRSRSGFRLTLSTLTLVNLLLQEAQVRIVRLANNGCNPMNCVCQQSALNVSQRVKCSERGDWLSRGPIYLKLMASIKIKRHSKCVQ